MIKLQQPPIKKPSWLKVELKTTDNFKDMKKLMSNHSLNIVCEEARCPNIGRCWSKKHATMMIMGDICTRACACCNVATGKPNKCIKEVTCYKQWKQD